jgi:hypothetical protein
MESVVSHFTLKSKRILASIIERFYFLIILSRCFTGEVFSVNIKFAEWCGIDTLAKAIQVSQVNYSCRKHCKSF